MRRWTLKQALLTTLAVLCAAAISAQQLPTNSHNLRTYDMNIFGPSAEAALRQAGLHAVRSAAGEFYCSDEMFLARDLLNRYLANYYERFLTSQQVLSRRESQGTVYLHAKFIVDIKALEADLREKRFFYKPKRRPFFYVTVAETEDGQPTSGEPISRQVIHETLDELPPRYEPQAIYTGNANIDLRDKPQQLIEARRAAQQAGVEVILTGRVELTQTQQKPIHFDEYTFYKADAVLQFIRVDDGEVLHTADYTAIAGNTDPRIARRVAARRAVGEILEDYIPGFSQRWERTMTDNVQFQIMVVGVNEDQAAIIHDRLETGLESVEVYRRSLFEDVAVFNLYYPPGSVRPDEYKRIEQILIDMASPQLKITPAPAADKIRVVKVS